MEDLVLSGGQVPCAADYEDLGSEIYSMIQRHDSMQPVATRFDAMRAEQEPPKQVVYVLYGVLGLALVCLAALSVKMF